MEWVEYKEKIYHILCLKNNIEHIYSFNHRVGIIANPPKHRCLCGFRGNFSIFWRQFGDNNVLRKITINFVIDLTYHYADFQAAA